MTLRWYVAVAVVMVMEANRQPPSHYGLELSSDSTRIRSKTKREQTISYAADNFPFRYDGFVVVMR